MEYGPFHEQVACITQDSGAAGCSPCPFYPNLQDLLSYSWILLEEVSYKCSDGLVVSSTHGLIPP